MTTGQIKVLVGCQNEDCATEVSYHLDMVRLLHEKPVCADCYDQDGLGMTEQEYADRVPWSDLPVISLEDLCE